MTGQHLNWNGLLLLIMKKSQPLSAPGRPAQSLKQERKSTALPRLTMEQESLELYGTMVMACLPHIVPPLSLPWATASG